MAVRRHGDEAVDGVADADLLVAEQLRHELERLGQLRVEVVLGEGELGGGERRLLVGGDVARGDDYRAVGVRAHLHVASVLALVHVRVDVAHDRVLDLPRRAGKQRDGADADHLVDDRGERDGGAGHRRQPWAPHSAADGDDVGLDVARRGADTCHLGSRADESVSMPRTSVFART